jgi:hypothetical protein
MKNYLTILAAIIGLSSLSYAGLPVQNMSSGSLALDYNGLLRGATITKQKVGAHENAHTMNFSYAPIPWLVLSAGLGAASYSVDTTPLDAGHSIFYNGRFGFAPVFGISGYTPYLAGSLLRVTAGARGHYLNTTDKTKQFGYGGLFATGGAGLIFSIGSIVDIELGGRGFFILGEMQKKGDTVQGFSNNNIPRGYLSVTLQTPLEGGYITVDFDASPEFSGDWSRGPAESSIGITAGMIFRSRTGVEKSKTVDDSHFPNYKDLEKKVENLQKELK